MTADLSFDPSIPVAEADTETDELIYRISHDLRASVRALQELPNWVLEDLDASPVGVPQATTRHLELISSHACRLDLMLTGLLEYSRIGRRQAIQPITPMEVLRDVIEDLGLPEGVNLSVRLDKGRVQMGDADLSRVFSILLTNAVRFHPDRAPRIELRGGPIAGGTWQIEVTDDGPGIPAAHRASVLRPMTKLVSRDIDSGAGMGLAILRKIATTYGGDVTIGDGLSGRGTSVRVTLVVN